MVHTRACARALSAASLITFTPCALARPAFDTYGQAYRPIAMPANAAGSFRLAGDVLPDGRMLAVTGTTVYSETAVGSGIVQPVAVIDPGLATGTDPAFIRVSSTGRIALGAGFGRALLVFDSSSLGTPGSPTTLGPANTLAFDVPHYDAAWADGTHLAITAGSFGSPAYVSLLDTLSNPGAPANPHIVDNIGGASAGVAFDSAGRLYTGNGFDAGPGGSGTGWIRAFTPDQWSGGAADFEGAGVLIGDVLSAGTLGFDREGNLFVGGGDFAQADLGYLGVINAGALASALAGSGPINAADPSQLLRLDPLGNGAALYDAVYNPVTGELYAAVTNFVSGSNTWYATVPAPASALLVALGGVLAARRRRHG